VVFVLSPSKTAFLCHLLEQKQGPTCTKPNLLIHSTPTKQHVKYTLTVLSGLPASLASASTRTPSALSRNLSVHPFSNNVEL